MEELCEKFDYLLAAREDYIDAKTAVPRYTGNLTSHDYYKEEEREYHEAMCDFIKLIKATE